MTYIPDESKVVYRSKDRRSEKIFDALEWLAAMCSHVPNKGEQMVRYGYFMWTPYTRRTSCHEPRNRDAAWRMISALFRSKRRLQ